VEQRNPEQIVHGYLEQVAHEIEDIPEADQQEILSDLRSHIDEAVGGIDRGSEAAIRTALDRLGHPHDVAREARSSLSDSEPASSPAHEPREGDKTPSALEVAAIILTALFWPIGVLLAWISPRWLTKDKVIATLIPAVSSALLGVVVLGGLVVYGADSSVVSVSTVVDEEVVAPGESSNPEPRSPSDFGQDAASEGSGARLLVVFAFIGAVIAGPFVTAVFLAIRLGPRQALAGASSGTSQRRAPDDEHSSSRLPAR
jgi:uncharacterized membrane protein